MLYQLGLSNYRDSIHYRDSLTLFMNKIVGCWTIQILVNVWDTYQLHWQEFREIHKNMICTEDHGQYLTNLCTFVYNQGVKELITHYCDSIHNCEYHNFYYCNSIILLSLSPDISTAMYIICNSIQCSPSPAVLLPLA